MIALVRGLSSEGVLWAATHDSDGRTRDESEPAQPAAQSPKVVTSLAGVDPRLFYSGELTWQ